MKMKFSSAYLVLVLWCVPTLSTQAGSSKNAATELLQQCDKKALTQIANRFAELAVSNRSPEALDTLLWESDSTLPFVRAVSGKATAINRALKKLATDPDLVCGYNRTRGELHLVYGFKYGELRQDADRYHISLSAGFEQPTVVGIDANGVPAVIARGPTLEKMAVRHALSWQVMARGPAGPRPVIRGRSDFVEAERFDDPRTFVTVLREQVGASPLRSNRLLDKAAKITLDEGCLDKLRHGKRGPRERMRVVGISAGAVGETLGRGRSIRQAITAIAESPGHRYALAARRFSDVGIAARKVEGRTCLAIVLAEYPKLIVKPHRK